jgi:hypothetical protein
VPHYKPTTVYKQEFPRGEAHSMDAKAFDDAIRSQGVLLVHYRAMACPMGLIHRDDAMRRGHEDHTGCSSGYLYKKAGDVVGFFSGNSTSPNFQDVGMIDGSTVTVTFDRTYDKTDEPVYVAPFDRFYLAESAILFPNWELIEHNLSGFDKLRFPAAKVQHFIDNTGAEYKQDVDFTLREGQILWTEGGRRPGIDPDTGGEQRGRVCSVWYLYQPHWYLQRLNHDGRIIQTEDASGERKVERMHMQATLVREHVFEAQQKNDDENLNTARETREPRDGSFPPR